MDLPLSPHHDSVRDSLPNNICCPVAALCSKYDIAPLAGFLARDPIPRMRHSAPYIEQRFADCPQQCWPNVCRALSTARESAL
jgi:hypothetical protein